MDSFRTFIPLSVDNPARSQIIFDFFDLMSAIAAHGKTNGFGGRKLSRMAAWWAFEQRDTGSGFEGGYKAWLRYATHRRALLTPKRTVLTLRSAADATSHLFFAYLRSLAPQPHRGGISMLPLSLQKLLQDTEYPPHPPTLMLSSTNKVVMIVDTVSPTPFALLRRGNHFQYRDEDRVLREFSEYEDPILALTEECRRVLKAISAANQTAAVSSSKHSTSLRDASWSRFEDIGFGGALEEEVDEDDAASNVAGRRQRGLRTTPMSGDGLARPTTPSWADFLSSGFVDDGPNSPTNLLLPPDKVLPPIDTGLRQRSSQSHRPRLESDRHLEPGELASITRFDLDDSFWWVWMSSLAPEETAERKSAFGRCAVIETKIRTGRWLVMEEMVKGAAVEPEAGAYIAEKKSFFSWTRRSKGVNRRKSTGKQALDRNQGFLTPGSALGVSKTSIGPEQQAKIQAAAQRLQARQLQEERAAQQSPGRRGRNDADAAAEKTNSVFTLQPVIVSEASLPMKWASKYDKEAIREAYLSNSNAGRGLQTNGHSATNGYDHPPEVPAKEPAQQYLASPATLKPSISSPAFDRDSGVDYSEKALEAPPETHPAERSGAPGRSTPLPPPPKEEPHSAEIPRERQVVSPLPDLSPESKKHAGRKLHKDNREKEKATGGAGGGLRKLFGRKNRTSKLPENAAADVNGMLAARGPTPEPAAPLQAEELEKPALSRNDTEFVTPREEPSDPMPHSLVSRNLTPGSVTPRTPIAPEPVYEPSVDTVSRVDTAEAREADHEFSRFDQGPLTDQPAFVPDESDAETEDAVPPPIARNRSPTADVPISPIEETAEGAKPAPVQDRWAQIRKNAAERAAKRQSEEQSRGGQSKTTDGDDDTSGEESKSPLRSGDPVKTLT